MYKIIRHVTIFLLLILLLPATILASDKPQPKLIIFHSPGCHRCVEVKQKVMPGIEQEFKDKVIIEYRDVGDLENYKMLLGLLQKSGSNLQFNIPVFYLGGKFLNAEGQLRDNLRSFILDGLKRNQPAVSVASADLVAYFKGFVPAAIIIAGLEDGVNPCAFTVIVFFISFLALQGYRKKELIFIGAAFILSVFLTYLCIGLGIFNFFYRFRSFWVITRLLNMIIGSLSILFGVLAIYDFIKFKRTGLTDDLVLQLPKPIKERIHKVVGFFYRLSPQEKQAKVLPSLGKLVVSALITGFLVSLLEAVCTGQVYLPTISFVLKASTLKLQALGYLLLYNIMFVVPLIVIFIFALMGTTSGQFSAFLKRHLGLIKILMAVLFFSLGIFLIWRG
jgi:cytochrome c biogenesis protein CcdA